MRISEVEIHEFVGTWENRQAYDPESTLEPPGFVLTIRTADGEEGYYRGFYFVPAMLAQVRMAAGTLIGRDPLEREELWQPIT